MPHVQVRNVPDDVHAELTRRADRSGQSLQQYLNDQLARLASTPSIDDVLDRLDAEANGTLSIDTAREALEAERARR